MFHDGFTGERGKTTSCLSAARTAIVSFSRRNRGHAIGWRKVRVQAEAHAAGRFDLRVFISGLLYHRLADLRTLVRASSGSSSIWPMVKCAGSSIRSRFRSRISLARCESPSMSRAMDRKVSYWRTL
jgi:hypothetical protein